MGAIKTGWDFFQDQILGMHWLKDLIGNLLVKAGMGESRFPGEFLHFFIYDVIKHLHQGLPELHPLTLQVHHQLFSSLS